MSITLVQWWTVQLLVRAADAVRASVTGWCGCPWEASGSHAPGPSVTTHKPHIRSSYTPTVPRHIPFYQRDRSTMHISNAYVGIVYKCDTACENAPEINYHLYLIRLFED